MTRGTSAFVAVALAACGDSAIVIEIDTALAPASEVELFLGTQICEEAACADGIAPPGAIRKLPGEIYFRDGAARFVSPVDSDGIARFRIEPGQVGGDVKYVLAVGGAEITGAVLIDPIDATTGPLRILTALEPVERFAGDRPPIPDVEGVSVWNAEAAACVMFQRDNGGRIARTFVVPDGDRDCDAIVADKCDAYIPNANTTPKVLEDARCSRPTGNRCQLGGLACNDSTVGVQCGPLPYCVNPLVCNECPDSASRTELEACVANTYAPRTVPGASRVVCRVGAITPDPNVPNVFEICEQPFQVGFVETSSGTCTAGLAELPLSAYSQDVTFVDAESRELRVEVAPVEPEKCKFELRIRGAIGFLGNEHSHVFAMAVGKPQQQTMLLPLEVQIVPLQVCEPTDPVETGCFVEAVAGDASLSCI